MTNSVFDGCTALRLSVFVEGVTDISTGDTPHQTFLSHHVFYHPFLYSTQDICIWKVDATFTPSDKPHDAIVQEGDAKFPELCAEC